MKITLLYLALCALGFSLTFIPRQTTAISNPPAIPFPGWPEELEGQPVEPVSLPPREAEFLRGFPGETASFSGPSGRWIVRWVTEPTRRLHPARHCFAGSGYAITPRGIVRDDWEQCWGCFEAAKDGNRWEVRERITDAQGHSWTDVSAWYWSAVWGKTRDPWWVYTRVTPGNEPINSCRPGGPR